MFDFSYTLTVVILGTMILGGIAGMLGTLLVLRQQALVGDALSHATLPGVALAFMFMNVRSLEVLLVGAFFSAVIAMILLDVIKNFSRIKFDAAMALILSAFFGFGQVLLSHLQKTGASAQAGLSRFIFGQAATLLVRDVYVIAGVAAFIFVLLLLFWKELKLYIFDEAFFNSIGYSRRFINGLMTFMVVVIITIGIRMVGVILMSALIIAPAVVARQFSNRFVFNVFLAGIVGATSAAIGTYLSSTAANVPTGPVIAVVLGMMVIISVMVSPHTSIIVRMIKNRNYVIKIKKYRKLIHFYENPQKLANGTDNYQYFLDHNYMEKERNTLKITQKGLKKIHSIKGVNYDEY